VPAAPLAATPEAARKQADRLAGSLPPLLVAALRVAATVEQGVHGRRRVGAGDAFWQFRQYQPGDPTARIDWRQSAKSDRLFLRQMEWAAAQSVWLWRDNSASMAWRSAPELPLKSERAEILILAVAALLLRAGERVALLGGEDRPSASRSSLERFGQALRLGPTESLPPKLALPRHAQLVLIGDFLSPLPAIDAVIRPYAERGLKGHLVQIHDPAEETLPFLGRIRFEGMEKEGELLLSRTELVQDAYRERYRAHRDGLMTMVRSLGWTFAVSNTQSPPEPALLALYHQIAEREK
jgi:uncharacterized protein (DUF58 family)